jgi:hypothetical protein
MSAAALRGSACRTPRRGFFHLELRQASASHATASNFDKLTEAESAICLVDRLRVKRRNTRSE